MLRMTRQRTAVQDVLASVEGFVSAQELHELLRERGTPIGLATVYRTIQTLADNGAVDVRQSPDGESLYRRCRQRAHHHHLVCRSCGATEEIAADVVERWTRDVGDAHGFSDVEHTVELTGTCATCSARRSGSPGASGGGDTSSAGDPSR
jgi:Fur family ferric uptake transcriptional regulator